MPHARSYVSLFVQRGSDSWALVSNNSIRGQNEDPIFNNGTYSIRQVLPLLGRPIMSFRIHSLFHITLHLSPRHGVLCLCLRRSECQLPLRPNALSHCPRRSVLALIAPPLCQLPLIFQLIVLKGGAKRTLISGARKIRFGAASDFGMTNYPYPSLAFAAQERFDFFILAGNTLVNENYFDRSTLKARWREKLSSGHLKTLAESTNLVAVPNDGDILKNLDIVPPTLLPYLLTLLAYPPIGCNSLRLFNEFQLLMLSDRFNKRP